MPWQQQRTARPTPKSHPEIRLRFVPKRKSNGTGWAASIFGTRPIFLAAGEKIPRKQLVSVCNRWALGWVGVDDERSKVTMSNLKLSRDEPLNSEMTNVRPVHRREGFFSISAKGGGKASEWSISVMGGGLTANPPPFERACQMSQKVSQLGMLVFKCFALSMFCTTVSCYLTFSRYLCEIYFLCSG